MHGYSNFACSPPPVAVASNGGRARRSLELTNTKETNAWEGLAIGAVTLARTFSTGSQRLCRSGEKARAGLPGAMRRAFSMRRHPAAAPGKGDGYYWRIHDMDGDIEHGDVGNAVVAEERDEEGEKGEEKKVQREEGDAKEDGKGSMPKKKRGNHVLKACKKLLRL
jgi:hypothetical protein